MVRCPLRVLSRLELTPSSPDAGSHDDDAPDLYASSYSTHIPPLLWNLLTRLPHSKEQ